MNIPGYRIDRRIGQGGMAMVYLATQESLQRPVALKVLNPLHSDTPEFTERFLNEGRMLASLGHGNIIIIHDIGAAEAFHYIAMEYVEGGDLKGRMRKGISVPDAFNYAETVSRALHFAHEKGIVHRDVKPANVMFRADGTLVLTDFGIAKQLGGESELTLTGSTIGSPHYLSPEQAQGKAVDARADIYSIGIMLFEMLTGHKPYRGDSDIDTVLKHLTEPPPRLPAGLEGAQPLLDRLLAKAVDDRVQTAAEAAEAFRELRENWSGSLDVTAPPLVRAAPPAAGAGDAGAAVAVDQESLTSLAVGHVHEARVGDEAAESGAASSDDPAARAVESNGAAPVDPEPEIAVHDAVPESGASGGWLKLVLVGALIGVAILVGALFAGRMYLDDLVAGGDEPAAPAIGAAPHAPADRVEPAAVAPARASTPSPVPASAPATLADATGTAPAEGTTGAGSAGSGAEPAARIAEGAAPAPDAAGAVVTASAAGSVVSPAPPVLPELPDPRAVMPAQSAVETAAGAPAGAPATLEDLSPPPPSVLPPISPSTSTSILAPSPAPEPDVAVASPAPASGAPSAPEANAAEIADLLASADRAMEAFRLTRPVGNSAIDFIGQVLELDPGNQAARESFKRIAGRYAVLARSGIGKGDYDKARLYVDRGLEVDGSNAELRALDAELDQHHASRPAPVNDSAAVSEGTTVSEPTAHQGETPAELFKRIKGFFSSE